MRQAAVQPVAPDDRHRGAVFLVACAVAYGGLFSHAYPGDVGMYERYGRELVLHGLIPYHDFFVEYPPGSVPRLHHAGADLERALRAVFKLMMTACGVGFVLCSAWIARRLDLSAWRLVPVVLAPVLMGPVFLNRYDPLAGAARVARARRSAARPRALPERAPRRRHRDQALPGRLRPARGSAGALRSPAAERRS